ncbi:MAG: DUF2357 domain-containing protein [Acholeplasmataceae bacterium]|nr:DUF2357 domain-containing protein [Acholeplasmataceae bacterium]
MENKQLNLFFQDLIKSFSSIEKSHDYPIYFYNELKKGQHQVTQGQITEAKIFEEDWADQIQTTMSSIVKITSQIKTALRRKEEVTIVEKAKKTDSRSIRHLVQNTQLIREVKDGNVIPKKVLINKAEVKINTYENIFIKSLVLKLMRYLKERRLIVQENIDALKTTNLVISSQFPFAEENIEVQIDVKRMEKVTRIKIKEQNEKLLNRITYLERQLMQIEQGEFMQILRDEKEVISPIMRTQVITKNPDFRKCYDLWVYLDQFPNLAYEVDSISRNKRFTEQYRKHLTQNLFHLITATLYHDKTFKQVDYRSYTQGKRSRYRPVLRRTVDLDLHYENKRLKAEETSINEFYLQESKKIFSDLIDQQLDEGYSEMVSMRHAMTLMTDITNALFKSYFEIDDPEFVTKMEGPEADLKDSLDKYRFVKMIREVKEKSLKEAMDVEERWLRRVSRQYDDLQSLNEESIARILGQRMLAEVEDLYEYQRTEFDKTLEVKEHYQKQHKERMEAFRKAEKERFNKRLASMYDTQKKRLEREKERVKTERQTFLERERAKRLKEKEQILKDEKKQKALIKDQFDKRIKNL